ncbi:MAG: MaoC family dehydratase [Dehalococcoidia bacterium]|nr:MaoC family dehydratase [Dehalococcoidia bacterium]MDW8120513.1 MaoC family dehydratase [Chloroflexota bacterium]
MVVQAKGVTWESIRIGDALPSQTKRETQETIDAFGAFRRAILGPRREWKDLHSDPEFARGGIFGATVNMGIATADYFFQVLEQAFPHQALFSPHSRYTFKAVAPIYAGDTVTITGKVVDKRQEEGRNLVVCELTGVNQRGQVVYVGTATVHFP